MILIELFDTQNSHNRLADNASQLLSEAKPENLGKGMMDKLAIAFKNKEMDDAMWDAMPPEKQASAGNDVAEKLYQAVGPKFLIWTAKQYVNEPHFPLEDLLFWKDTLTQFATVAADRRAQIEKDINKYPSIAELRKTLVAATATTQELGTTFFSKALSGIDPFVKSGDAIWLYKGNDYAIYHPKTFESSNILSKNLIGSVSVCTVMGKDQFDTYTAHGVLLYIISQDKMYNCYINTNDNKDSEFADQHNDHDFNLDFMLENFPKLKGIIRKCSNENTDFDVMLKVVDNVHNYIMGSSPEVIYRYAKQHLDGQRFYDGEPLVATDPRIAVMYARDIMGGRFIEAEPLISQDPHWAYTYTKEVINRAGYPASHRWPEGEPAIASNETTAVKYAKEIIGGRFPEGEEIISQFAGQSYYYAKWVIKGRFPEGEPAIAKDARSSVLYASEVIFERFPAGEPVIMTQAITSYQYAKNVIGGRWPEGEKTIASDARFAYEYADEILNGRFPEGEKEIAKDPHYTWMYLKTIIKGPLPEFEPALAHSPIDAFNYALVILKGRFPAGEPAIASDSFYARIYAEEIIGGRWEEGEAAIALEPEQAFKYAKEVLKTRFPEGEKAIASDFYWRDGYDHWFDVELPRTQ